MYSAQVAWKQKKDVSALLCLNQNEKKRKLYGIVEEILFELESFEIKYCPIPIIWTIFIFIGMNKMQEKPIKFAEYFRCVTPNGKKRKFISPCDCERMDYAIFRFDLGLNSPHRR